MELGLLWHEEPLSLRVLVAIDRCRWEISAGLVNVERDVGVRILNWSLVILWLVGLLTSLLLAFDTAANYADYDRKEKHPPNHA